MSHYTCLVIGNNYDLQLEPFWELDLPIEQLKKDPRAEFYLKYTTKELKTEYKEFTLKNPNYGTFKEWISDYYGYVYDKKSKGYGYYHNPNAKWDWYVVGGRWSGFFKLKENGSGSIGKPGVFGNIPKNGWADQAMICDIDFEGMMKRNIKGAKKNWKAAKECDPIKRSLLYGIRENDTKESYIRKNSSISTFAVVYDGEWYEQGSMGWWGMVSDEKNIYTWNIEFDKLLESLSDDTMLTLCDCHI